MIRTIAHEGNRVRVITGRTDGKMAAVATKVRLWGNPVDRIELLDDMR